MNKPENQTTD